MKNRVSSPKIGLALLKSRLALAKSFGQPNKPLDLSLAVVSYNQWAVSERFLKSLSYPQAPSNAELIWVDNGSSDGSVQRLKSMKWKGLGGFRKVTLLLLKKNYFISGAVNCALSQARGKYFIQADNDVLFSPGSLDAYLSALRSKPDSLLSPLWQLTQGLLSLDFEPACYADLPRAFKRLARANAWLSEESGVAAGSCWGGDRKILSKLGGWSEDYRLQCMDDDMVLRWRASGRPAGLLPLPVFHPGLKTRRADSRASAWELEDVALFQKRWQGRSIDQLRDPRPFVNSLLSSRLAKVLRALRIY